MSVFSQTSLGVSSSRTSPSRFHVIIKPMGSLCNLRCDYCYYLCKHDSGLSTNQRMSDQALETFIRQYIQGQTVDEVFFSWQGGEPTLLGVDFFRHALQLQRKYQRPGLVIHNDIQTNGILLDDPWCRFLKDNDFLVGISIDGPQELHDCYRRDAHGQGTFTRVMAAIRLLQNHGVKYNTLTTIHRLNARHPKEVYRFLRDQAGSLRMQFQPCVVRKDFQTIPPQHWKTQDCPITGSPAARPGTPDSIVTDFSADPEDLGTFFCGMWDAWFPKDVGHRSISFFETTVSQAMGGQSLDCVHHRYCGKNMASVESNGNVSSCEYYVYPEYRLGNFLEQPLAQLALSQQQMDFGFQKHRSLPAYCRQCEHLKLCWGECPRTRIVRTPDGQPGLSYFCPALKRFYTHIQKDLPAIFQAISLT